MTLMELLKLAQGNRGLNAFASHAGIDAGNLSRIMKGQKPSPKILRKLANKAQNGITYEQLMAAAQCQPTEEDFAGLVLEELSKYVPTEDFLQIPVVSGVHVVEKEICFDRVVKHMLLSAETISPNAFFIQVEEMDMYPYIQAGDLALIRTDLKPAHLQLALVFHPLNMERACIRKIIRCRSKIILQSFNPEIAPQMFKASELEIIGQVVETRRIW